MEPSTELRNFLLNWYESMGAGDTSVVDRLIAHQEGCILIGTDERNWYRGYEAVTGRLNAELMEMRGIRMEAGKWKFVQWHASVGIPDEQLIGPAGGR